MQQTQGFSPSVFLSLRRDFSDSSVRRLQVDGSKFYLFIERVMKAAKNASTGFYNDLEDAENLYASESHKIC